MIEWSKYSRILRTILVQQSYLYFFIFFYIFQSFSSTGTIEFKELLFPQYYFLISLFIFFLISTYLFFENHFFKKFLELTLKKGSGYSLYLFFFVKKDKEKKDAATIPKPSTSDFAFYEIGFDKLIHKKMPFYIHHSKSIYDIN